MTLRRALAGWLLPIALGCLHIAACGDDDPGTPTPPASGPTLDASNATITAAPATGVAADGSSPVTLTATVNDSDGNAFVGAAVLFRSTGSGNIIVQPSQASDANGSVVGSLMATVAEAKTVTAVAITATGTVELAASASVTFDAPVGVDAVHLAFTTQPTTLAAGGTLTFTVEVRDENGGVVTGATPMISVGLLDNAAGGALLGTTSVAAVGGIANFDSLTIDRAGSGYTLFATAVGLVGSVSDPFEVTAGAAAAFVVSTADPFVALTANDLDVTVLDAFGNLADGYVGTVTFATTDPVGSLPSDYTFVAGDAGMHSFTGGAFLATSGVQVIWATDTSDAGISGAGTAAVAADVHFEVTGITDPVPGGVPSDVIVTALDSSNNVVSNYRGTITFGSSSAASLPADYTFTAADAGTHTFAGGVLLYDPGMHTVSVDDGFDGTGEQVGIDVTEAPPQVTGVARYLDRDGNGFIDAGDELVVPFIVSVVVNGGSAADFSVPVTGDALGSGASIAAGPASNEITITLGAGPSFRARGLFDPAATGANAPSGIDVAAGIPADTIESSISGIDALPSVPIDIVVGFASIGPVVSGFSITTLAAGDLDGDGDADLVTGSYSNNVNRPNVVWTNQGGAQSGTEGSFAQGQLLTEGTTNGLSMVDTDRDGDLDLVEVTGVGMRLWVNQGGAQAGTLGQLADSGQSLSAGDTGDFEVVDVDLDGDLDFILAQASPLGFRVWLNQGGVQGGTLGAFADSGDSYGSATQRILAAADIDGDGDVDFVGAGSSLVVTVGLNQGGAQAGTTGTFATTTPISASGQVQRMHFADVDRDGDPDLLVGSLSGIDLWLNNGGSFSNAGSIAASHGASAIDCADIDMDGNLDLLTSVAGDTGQLLLGDGAGGFADVGQSIGVGRAQVLADFDGDGDLDVLDGDTGTVTLWRGAGSGTSGQLAFTDSGQALGSGGITDMAAGDLDGDGDLDLVSVTAAVNGLWFNDAGAFSDSGQALGTAASSSAALGDVDLDGDLDLLVGNAGANVVWLNDGAGILSDSGQRLGTSTTTDVALGDVDGDGDLDFVASNTSGQANQVWLNQGGVQAGSHGVFAMGSGFGSSDSTSVALGDVDNDGDLDIVIGNRNSTADYIYLNDGAGTPTGSGQSLGGDDTASVALADIDGDSDLDLLTVSDSAAQNRVWLNDGAGAYTFTGVAAQTLGTLAATAVAVADLDLDGSPDAVTGTPAADRVWVNTRSGAFSDSNMMLGATATNALVIADVDGDGADDFIAAGGTTEGAVVWLHD